MPRRYGPRSLHTVLRWRHYLKGEKAVGLEPLLNCWRNNLHSDKVYYYDFKQFRPELFYRDDHPWPRSQEGATCNGRCDDKVAFYLQLKAIGAPTPEVVAENVEGRMIYYAEPHDLDALLEARGELVIKPRGGKAGNGVRIVRPGDADRFLEPGEFASTKVVQHAYSATINPASINTVRMLTAWDYDAGDFFVAGASHRFGTALSKRVDNWSAGGVSAGVDVETGRLGPAMPSPSFDHSRTWLQRHPDTGAQIEGVEVARFHQMSRELLEVCRGFPVTLVGWDVVITPDAWTILEANRRPAFIGLQMYRPLLADPRVKTFFARERML